MPTCCGDTALNKAWFLLSISVTLEEKEKKIRQLFSRYYPIYAIIKVYKWCYEKTPLT